VAKEAAKSEQRGSLAGGNAGKLIITVFSILYFADVLVRASEKFFWYDELFTVYLSRLNVPSLWSALADGADYNPPLFYLLTRACVALFGEGNTGVRVPEILGYWVFSLCLYRFASRRAGVLAGTIAMLFPMVTSAYYYAYEARPHGIVFGFCGLALVCWQISEDSAARRRAALFGFAAALLGALMMHCYAVLILAPFGCAGVVRILETHRIRWDFWIALITPAMLSLTIYVPLLRSYKNVQRTTDFANVALPGWSQVGHFYGALWAPCMAIVAAILIILLLDFRDRRIAVFFSARRELLLAVFFMLLPVFGVLLGKATHAPFFHRYFYTAAGGMAIALGIGTALPNERSRAAVFITALLAVAILVNSARLAVARWKGQGEKLREESAGFLLNTKPDQPLAMHSVLMQDRSALPIAVVNPFDYIYLDYYAPRLRDRIYSVSFAAGTFTYFAFERLIRCCDAFAHEPTVLGEFQSRHKKYLLYGDAGTADQIRSLASPGTYIEATTFRDEHFLARVSRQ